MDRVREARAAFRMGAGIRHRLADCACGLTHLGSGGAETAAAQDLRHLPDRQAARAKIAPRGDRRYRRGESEHARPVALAAHDHGETDRADREGRRGGDWIGYRVRGTGPHFARPVRRYASRSQRCGPPGAARGARSRCGSGRCHTPHPHGARALRIQSAARRYASDAQAQGFLRHAGRGSGPLAYQISRLAEQYPRA